jgi:beta-xylosidase
MNLKDFIKDFATTTKDYIEKYEQYKELSGEQKKARVDDILTSYCEAALDNLGFNFIFKFVFRKLIVQNIPAITQAIFDLLKAKVAGITK